MKCSSLLKPNKISYTHQNNSKHNPSQLKAKISSRHSTQVNQRSSMADLMIIANTSKKSIMSTNSYVSNKENQPKNGQLRQQKKDLSSSRPNPTNNNPNHNKNKQLDMYLSSNLPKPQTKLHRNMSMHISPSDIMQQAPTHHMKLNNSCLSNYAKQIHPINNSKKRKLSKPLLQNSSLFNVNNHHRHSSVVLTRSPLSDKSVLIKDSKDNCRKEDRSTHLSKHQSDRNYQKQHIDSNYDSCKSVQSSRAIEQSKSVGGIGQRKISNMDVLNQNHNSKPSVNFMKKAKSPKQTTAQGNSQHHSKNPPTTTKTQSKPNSILVLKQNKTHDTNRKIKRSKLIWLFIINRIYAQTSQASQPINLYQIAQDLKQYEKRQHPVEEIITEYVNAAGNQQQVTLTQLLLFVKVTLLNNPHLISSTVMFKPHSNNQIDPQKTHLTEHNFGQILFSQQSIIKHLQHQQLQPSFNNQHSKHHPPISQSPSSSSHLKNPHNISTKQDQEIVQTARFQENNQNSHHHSRQSSDGISHRGNRKKTIFMDPNHKEPFTEGIELINSKLQQKSANSYGGSAYGNNPSHSKRPSEHELLYPSPIIDKSFISRKSSSTSTNKEPRSNGTTNKQISHCSIEDISEILNSNSEHQKPLATSFNKNFYPSGLANNSRSLVDPFAEDSFLDNENSYKKSNAMQMQEIDMEKGLGSGKLESCRIQALNMNSSLLFLESVILNNLYHTNFNVSFSEQPMIDNDDSSLMRSEDKGQTTKTKTLFSKLEDVIQQVENILKSMKKLFFLDEQLVTHNDQKFRTKQITKESIKIQDLTEMQEFLTQFIDYKVFRKQTKSSGLGFSHLSEKNEYFNAVKLTEHNLTSLQTCKAAKNIIKSPMICKYFSFIEGVRINQGPCLIQNIDQLLLSNKDEMSRIRILNLGNNDLKSIDGLMNVIEANMEWLEFLNLSNNKIESIEGLFRVFIKGNSSESNEITAYEQLRELHLKNNQISVINCKSLSSPSNYSKNTKKSSYSSFSSKTPQFPNLELLDLRSNNLSVQQKESIEQMIFQSPNLAIMSLKQNPIMEIKTSEKSELEKLMNKRSIYEYDSLQMMSAYIKYKDITFSDSGENCCSVIEEHQLNDSQAHDGFVERDDNGVVGGKNNYGSKQQNMLIHKKVSLSRIQCKQQQRREKQRAVEESLNRRKIRSIKSIQLEDNFE